MDRARNILTGERTTFWLLESSLLVRLRNKSLERPETDCERPEVWWSDPQSTSLVIPRMKHKRKTDLVIVCWL